MRTLLGLTASGAVSALALAACGGSTPTGSPPSGSPTQVVAAAATATQSAGTALVDMTELVQISGVPSLGNSSVRVTAHGGFDVGQKLAALAMDLGAGTGARHLRIFADGSTVYLSTAGLGLTGVKPWIKLDASSAGSGVTSLASSPFNGAQLLSKLTNVTAAGNQTLHGAVTTHYHGTLDLGTALAQLGGTTSGLGQLGQLGPALQNALAGTTAPVDVWIDGQDRVRRFETSLDLGPVMRTLLQSFEGSSGGTVPTDLKALLSIDFSLHDFGAHLDLTPPPASQVGPAPPGFTLPGTSSL